MSTTTPGDTPKSINDIKTVVYPDDPKTKYHPSPSAWEDQVLYFLLPDRFSDGHETKLYNDSQKGNAVTDDQDAQRWRDAGVKFVGGTLHGLHTKVSYLQRLGVVGLFRLGPA